MSEKTVEEKLEEVREMIQDQGCEGCDCDECVPSAMQAELDYKMGLLNAVGSYAEMIRRNIEADTKLVFGPFGSKDIPEDQDFYLKAAKVRKQFKADCLNKLQMSNDMGACILQSIISMDGCSGNQCECDDSCCCGGDCSVCSGTPADPSEDSK